jgi:hypothetical protein
MVPICCLETWESDNQSTLRNVSEKRKYCIYTAGGAKSRLDSDSYDKRVEAT